MRRASPVTTATQWAFNATTIGTGGKVRGREERNDWRCRTDAGRDRRNQTDLLGPLKRYLRKQVGRRWDDVYRDLSAHRLGTAVIQQHLRDHVRMYVKRIVDVGPKGRVRAFTHIGWVGGRWRELSQGDLYVDPRSGVLKVVKRRQIVPNL